MVHANILEASNLAEAPVQIQHAFLQELSVSKVDFLFHGFVFADLEFSRGGRQGASDTPFLWTRLWEIPVARAKARWLEEGLAFTLPPKVSSLLRLSLRGMFRSGRMIVSFAVIRGMVSRTCFTFCPRSWAVSV